MAKDSTYLNGIALNSRNTYQYNNSSIFYSNVNNNFLPYYQTVIRKSQQWLDGYDPAFHKRDIVSTRIAARLFNCFRNAIFGRGLIFVPGKKNTEKDNKTLNFISHDWADKSNIQNATKQLIGYTVPLGTAALKINKDIGGKLWVEPLRIDYFYFSVDGRRKVIDFTSFIRCFQSVDNKELNYFLVEHRYFKTAKETFVAQINGKSYEFKKEAQVPYVEYKVFEYQGTVQSNTMGAVCKGDGLNFKTLPAWVQKAINQQYSVLKVGEPQVLPFTDYLGVELFFNEGGDITNPTLPFGRALCFDCLSDFMEFDMNKSYALRDLYNSKGIVGVPRMLNQGDIGASVPGTAGNMTKLQSAFGQLDIPGYEQVKGLDPNTQKPIITQFEMRVVEHEQEDMKILKSIATIVGVSPRAIASFLIQNGEKTDDQIQSEDDTVTQWIKTHREDYVEGLNRVIECVLNYNAKSENVEVRFASDGLLKGDKQLDSVERRLNMGVIDIEDAVRELNPDLDEEQLQTKIAKAQQNQELQRQQFDMNEDGSFDKGYSDQEEADGIIENELKQQ